LLDDLEYARGIQMAMLPKKLPDSSATAFEACYFPAERVGGTFTIYFRLRKRK
jgi:serine phosphatase RsbU (regulator of sigma subunit)